MLPEENNPETLSYRTSAFLEKTQHSVYLLKYKLLPNHLFTVERMEFDTRVTEGKIQSGLIGKDTTQGITQRNTDLLIKKQ